MVVCGDLCHFAVVCGRLRWFVVVWGGLRWFAVVCLIVIPAAPGLPLSVTLIGVCNGVDLASPSIKRNLNICQCTIDDGIDAVASVGLFQNITNVTLIIGLLENDSTMSCKKRIILRDVRLHLVEQITETIFQIDTSTKICMIIHPGALI